ncbi:hypothetical protein LWC35_37375 [Pseudonocardia kujensis]|uniref:hypothetical protein n=1 Tax=Pseudonocardia kujensis TaxID=1128675 RepID=UPI001E30A391|nr:hypothetical protein [Pseudonocardia kujensis]MCE0768525.1 hypothetical protein [Pseudonocardia kujensis]
MPRAETDDAYTAAVAANPGFRGQVGAVVLPYDGKCGAYTPGDARGQVMAGLGFTLPQGVAALDTGERFFVEVAPGRVGILDGDVLVMLADQPAARAAVDADAVLRQVRVVVSGRMIVPDTDTRGAMSYNSVLSVLSVPYAPRPPGPAAQDRPRPVESGRIVTVVPCAAISLVSSATSPEAKRRSVTRSRPVLTSYAYHVRGSVLDE